ncbi:hypothetical protein GCM10027521_35530 [Amycolatopsis cihanbeyliensis]
MSTRLEWRRTAEDTEVHGWTGDCECGWPVALCGYSCRPRAIIPCSTGHRCPDCARLANQSEAPIPPASLDKRRWQGHGVHAALGVAAVVLLAVLLVLSAVGQ